MSALATLETRALLLLLLLLVGSAAAAARSLSQRAGALPLEKCGWPGASSGSFLESVHIWTLYSACSILKGLKRFPNRHYRWSMQHLRVPEQPELPSRVRAAASSGDGCSSLSRAHPPASAQVLVRPGLAQLTLRVPQLPACAA